MTGSSKHDEADEMERIRSLLRNSTSHLKKPPNDSNDKLLRNNGGKRKRDGRSNDKSGSNVGEHEIKQESITTTQKISSIQIEGVQDEAEPTYGEDDGQDLILPPRKKKAKKQKSKSVQLSAHEIRQAKQQQKKHERKMQKLAEKEQLKQKRADLYNKLKENAISSEEAQLLSSSSTLGKRTSKRELLKRALQKERAGVTLTDEEQSLLYMDRGVIEDDDSGSAERSAKSRNPREESKVKTGKEESTKKKKSKINETNEKSKDRGQVLPESELIKGDPSSSQIPQQPRDSEDESNDEMSGNDDMETEEAVAPVAETKDSKEKMSEPTKSIKVTQKSMSFAAQMMSSMMNLKKRTDEKKAQNEEKADASIEAQLSGVTENKKTPYVPTNTAILKTAASMKLKSKEDVSTNKRRVLEVKRPADVQENRQDLPVCGMEYEIVDAIRNNDVVIVCSETGSGKSTQIPQFLYEAGFSLGNDKEDSSSYNVGVTQPRRVAAISTAKRVCYEMGHGDGNTIQRESRDEGNMVAYQTRYESAGLGKKTQIKFMTDGILLSEIQADLILRKYSVIVLDEAHERNLNTDVLLGLLSVAIPLRRKAAAQEGSNIVPLKLVIMSATLRVDDFTKNDKLFPSTTPVVVTVPGRTHPVTIHHSKVTEMEEYENAALQKVCKIHRKLPPGGILVFLTGKQEIVRMVNKLRKMFAKKSGQRSKTRRFSGINDVTENATDNPTADGGYRDMDDDELDGDLYQDHDDFENMDDDDEVNADEEDKADIDDDSDIPKYVHVLPLYSMLAVEEQAKVFAAVPEGHRLIVVATNIAETSLTIPGISYVVDTGRHKCRNYHPETGVASYDVMWISKAAADQRAGRAGRTGPGHCYRLFSSTMYSRHMSDFALPEVLTRPLEDVVLAMKALKVKNVVDFPFPTPPSQGQIDSAIKLLADIGCVDLCNEDEECDGEITELGVAASRFPTGVRYGKMLVVAAKAGVLDYAIALVAVLSQSSPFVDNAHDVVTDDKNSAVEGEDEDKTVEKKTKKWSHRGGDPLAGLIAAGAYAYAGRGAGGASERVACRKFCEENGLSFVVMDRIQKMRVKLARLVKTKLGNASGLAAKRGGVQSDMPPPNALEETRLIQVLTSGLLDNVAVLAPPGSIVSSHPHSSRSAYLSCSSTIKEPLFMDRTSVVYSRDSRRMPEWVCYQSVVRSLAKDGETKLTMKNVTPVNPSWLGNLSIGSRLLSLGMPIPSPVPTYDAKKDAVLCSVVTKFGSQGLEIPPIRVEMYNALQSDEAKRHSQFAADDSFRWFARFLLEGKVLPELENFSMMLNDDPAVITRKTPVGKAALLVSALSSQGVDSAAALRKHWAEVDKKFLFKQLSSWTLPSKKSEMKQVWMDTVRKNINLWKKNQ